MGIRAIAILIALLCSCGSMFAQNNLELSNSFFRIAIQQSTGTIVQLKSATDTDGPNFVMGPADYPQFSVPDARWVGDIDLRYRTGDGPWTHASTARSGSIRHISQTHDGRGTEVTVEYSGNSDGVDQINGLTLKESYRLEGEALLWRVELQNDLRVPIEVGDVGLPLLFNTYYAKDPITTYQQRLIRHSYIEGNNSYIFWMRPDGAGPFLLMTPAMGTHLEYFNAHSEGDSADAPDNVFARRGAWEGLYTTYIHAKAQAIDFDRGGSWRQPITSTTLAPRGKPGSHVTYEFAFHWESDYARVRNELYNEGLIDTEVAPGMVVPIDLDAYFSLRSRQSISSVEPEFPTETSIESLPSPDPHRSTYRVRFHHLGENLISVHYGQEQRTQLEFFVSESIELLIKKRAAFLVQHQQVHDPARWYNAEFSLWDMRSQSLRTPDDVADLDPYMVGGSDDPDLCKAPYIAAKNILYPNEGEIGALENYIDAFVWGKLQRTDQESPYPFGVYGTPSWFELRNSKTGLNSGGNGREHMWRTFDYTHLIQLYFEMYRIAKLYPGMVHRADADEYLNRAYGTAKAFFQVPYEIKMGTPWAFRGWTDWAYKQGNFHEVFIPDLIDALIKENRQEEAHLLRIEWEKKVLYFLYDHPYPFGSEMYFDTTAFESTHAIANYATQHKFDPTEAAWADKNSGHRYEHSAVRQEEVSRFAENEVQANVAARGYLETNYYQLGSDIRQGGNSNYLLSYMTQMGGWSILDFASKNVDHRMEFLRLGYASYLAGWADINAGTPESRYGFWFPGKDNDGAAGWGFNPQKVGFTWVRGMKQIDRGIWPYDGEIDSGFSGAIRAAAVLVVKDPVFGLMAYGGDVTLVDGSYRVLCKDGVGQRVSIFVMQKTLQPLRISLTANHFSSTQPLSVSANASEISMFIQETDPSPQATELTIEGMPQGQYQLSIDGVPAQDVHISTNERLSTRLGFAKGPDHHVMIRAGQPRH